LNTSDAFFNTFAYKDYAEINIRNTNGFFYTDRSDLSKSHLAYPVMDYSEVCFLKAEAALRGYIAGDAETFYNDGIKASISYVASVSGVAVTDAKVNTYIAALPSYSSAPTNEAKLRLICMQEYIALFPNSQEAWSLVRRTGYPDNLTYPQSISGSALVVNGNWIQRLSYPNSEYSNDADNIPADYKSGATKYDKREQYGVWWSLAGDGKTYAKGTTPANNF